jgi:hypothetical protein
MPKPVLLNLSRTAARTYPPDSDAISEVVRVVACHGDINFVDALFIVFVYIRCLFSNKRRLSWSAPFVLLLSLGVSCRLHLEFQAHV